MRGQTEPAVANVTASSQAATGSASIVPNSGAFVCVGGRRRPGGRPADVMSDLSAARTTTRFGQCRESWYPPSEASPRSGCPSRGARRTHEFARSAGRDARTEPTTPNCQGKRHPQPQFAAKLSFNLSKFRLLWQTTQNRRGGVVKKTSQRSLLFRQNVNRTEAEWVHFLVSRGPVPVDGT